jgi:polyvinyl alcohol dehydrogenase (cytochrome)
MANGVTIYAPGGGGVWNTPTIDPVRNAVYFGTGDATTAPSPKTTDAIMAVDLKSGDLLWSYQADENDVFMVAAPARSAAMPVLLRCGPDLDIGNPPILKTLPNGKRVLIAGTKRGHVFALDPDDRGKLLYRVLASTERRPPTAPPAGGGRGGGGGSIVWGGSADDQNVYYVRGGAAGLVALRLGTGEKAWSFTSPAYKDGETPAAVLGAAPTSIPGVVFEGFLIRTTLRRLHGRRKATLGIQHRQDFTTVNQVPARGGAISTTGATIAVAVYYHVRIYAISSAQAAGNVLLSFGID